MMGLTNLGLFGCWSIRHSSSLRLWDLSQFLRPTLPNRGLWTEEAQCRSTGSEPCRSPRKRMAEGRLSTLRHRDNCNVYKQGPINSSRLSTLTISH
jgi:hypothetical protein